MTRLGWICAATIIAVLPNCSAQTGNPGNKPTKPAPTARELVSYVREQLLALSPSDGVNDNVKVTFNQATWVLSITQPDGRCDFFLKALDAEGAAWEVYNPSEPGQMREPLLRLSLSSSRGNNARTCYDNQHSVDTRIPQDHVRFLFSQDKANAVPNFQENMEKAVKNLVALALADLGPRQL
jgi:hypothetical protein